MTPLSPRHRAPFPTSVSWLLSEPSSAYEIPLGGVLLVSSIPDAVRDASIVETFLSGQERARRDRIQHPRAFAEFLTGRRLMRTVLGHLLGVAPAAVALLESSRGALSLDPAQNPSGLSFNLSHTEGLVVLAVAHAAVGVDVEWLDRPGRTVELADRYFARAELEALRALPPERQRDRFFELWTLKEAYIKARGLGLAIPLGSFSFSGFEDSELRIEVDASQSDRPDAHWRFGLWDLASRHRLALALASPTP